MAEFPEGINYNTAKLLLAWEVVKASGVIRDPPSSIPPSVETLVEAINQALQTLGEEPKKPARIS